MAIRSMTGFGSARRSWAQAPGGPASVSLEIRSVNSRFLEVKVRQPFGVAAEHGVRKQVEGFVGRGRVDVWIHVQGLVEEGTDALASAGVDAARLDQALRAAREVQRRASAEGLEVSPPTPVELLRFSASLSHAEAAPQAPPFLDELVAEAATALVAMREREGEALSEVLTALLSQLESQMSRLDTAISGQAETAQDRLQARVEELCDRVRGASPDRDRLAQEVAVLVAKSDVAEEVARIHSHLGQGRGVLAIAAEPGQGKTLDFLSQELLREITTIGGKIHEGTEIVIEAKGTVGRIREQVQNVE